MRPSAYPASASPAHQPPRTGRRPVRLSALALALALLALPLLSPARAPARPAGARHASCVAASRHARRGARPRGCVQRSGRNRHGAERRPARQPHPSGGGAHRSSDTAPTTPALCEDSSAPVLSEGRITCQDGSEPSCEDGSEPLTPAGGGAPVCAAEEESSGSGGEACPSEGDCEPVEAGCEAPPDASEASPACAREQAGTRESSS